MARLTDVDESVRQAIWFSSSLLLMALAVVATGQPGVVVASTLLAVAAWNRVHHGRYFRHIVVRRALKPLPYLAPLPTFGIDLTAEPLAFALAAIPVIGLHLITRRDLRLSFSPALLQTMPRRSPQERWTETYFFAAPAIAQEYLYRYVVLDYLIHHQGVARWIAVVAGAALFTLEHFIGTGRHTRRNVRNTVTWLTIGLSFGAVVAYLGSLPAVMLAHLMLNLPACIQPHLRGRPATKGADRS